MSGAGWGSFFDLLDKVEEAAGGDAGRVFWFRERAERLAERVPTRVGGDPWVLALRLGVRVRWGRIEGAEGLCVAAPGAPVVVLDDRLSEHRARDVLAHELAHFLLGEMWPQGTAGEVVEAGERRAEAVAEALFGFGAS